MILTHQTEYNEAIQAADRDFHASNGKEMVDLCPYLFSSNMADAYWIAAYCLYHTGRTPESVHKSKGNKWNIYARRLGECTVEVVNPDQRTGVKIH